MDQLRRIVRSAETVLGPGLVGAYQHGSGVLGGLRPASDLDVLVVTRQSMTTRQREALLAALLAISGPAAGGRPVELTVVVQAEVRPWRFPPTADFLYGEWLRAELTAGGPPRPEPMPDLALLIAMVLAGDRPLAGPPPAQVLEPVPPADLARASLAGIAGLLADLAGDTRNVVLTFARIWATVATGEIRSKDAAARWALDRLPPEHRPVLRHARDLYRHTSYAAETWSPGLRSAARPCVDEMLFRIRAAAADRDDLGDAGSR
ncbi:aminoglycoside adenylyltransferase family protein [Amorphoplanes nipponensis]|nr:aminoglycoside adenylyltransferase domain-containing protein [Actinoplanes nipponensis]